MKLKFMALLFSLLAGLLLAGCQTASLQNASYGVNVKPAMWQVDHGDSKVYLLGSFHVLPPTVKWYSPRIAVAYQLASELVVESDVDDGAMEAAMRSAALLPDGKTLEDYLTPDRIEELKEAADVLELNTRCILRYQPWFVAVVFSQAALDKSGLKHEYGVDQLLLDDARKRGVKVSSLEKIDEIMHFLTAESLDEQIAALNRKEPEKKTTSDELEEFFYAWAYGDMARLDRLNSAAMSKDKYETTIVRRNLLWIDRIETYFRKPQQTFIVVGAAHMAGEHSLIALLKERGYRVERVQ